MKELNGLYFNEYSLTEPVVRTFDALHNQEEKLRNSYTHFHDSGTCTCQIIPVHLQEQISQLKETEGSSIAQLQKKGIEDLTIDENLRTTRQQVVSQMKDNYLSDKDKFFEELSPGALAGFWHTAKKSNPYNLNDEQLGVLKKQIRQVFDAKNEYSLPGHHIQTMISAKGVDGYKKTGFTWSEKAKLAMQNALDVYLYLLTNHNHNAINGKGAPIISVVGFGDGYNNAMWNAQYMIYGDGDGKLFDAFVKYLDVVGHEMAHGVIGNKLIYKGQAGALNEHIADVIGYLVYMMKNKLTPSTASWLLAENILSYNGKKYALRSFKNPGQAYDNPELGKDPQPDRFSNLYTGKDDEGGVHINSGIPNRAFYLFATQLEEIGVPWIYAGQIWFKTLMRPNAFPVNATMQQFAEAIIQTAETWEVTRNDTRVINALRNAWQEVEVIGVAKPSTKE